jgi:hypothetical protein
LLKLLTGGSPLVPSIPIAATRPATSDQGNGRRTWPGSRHDELFSAVRKPEAPYGTLPTLHRFGRRRISASPGSIRRSRRKSHFVSSIEEGVRRGKVLLQRGGTQRMRPVVRTAFDPRAAGRATVRFSAAHFSNGRRRPPVSAGIRLLITPSVDCLSLRKCSRFALQWPAHWANL